MFCSSLSKYNQNLPSEAWQIVGKQGMLLGLRCEQVKVLVRVVQVQYGFFSTRDILVRGITCACCENVFQQSESPNRTPQKIAIHFHIIPGNFFLWFNSEMSCPWSPRTARMSENVKAVKQSFLQSQQRSARRHARVHGLSDLIYKFHFYFN